MKLVDSHCHLNMLDLSAFDDNLDTVMDLAKSKQVQNFLCVSINIETLADVLNLAERYPEVYASVGVHPNEQGQAPSVELLCEYAKHPKVIAIGETGLDNYHKIIPADEQKTRFVCHIQAAKQCRKPLIIHTRDAREETLDIMRAEDAASIGGVMHCFTETLEMAKAALEMNFFISFSGIVTFKNAKALQAVAKYVPLSKMLIETDSPYLTPVPYRGKANHPANVYYVAKMIASLKGIDLETVAMQTTDNFNQLFQMTSSTE